MPALSSLKPRSAALAALCEPSPSAKVAQVFALWEAAQALSDEAWQVDEPLTAPSSHAIPGRPTLPELVPPRAVGKRGLHTVAGRAALLHALTHIEFNAINLALDALWRFTGMPVRFYREWLQVAKEEAYHFSLLRDHLHTLGYAYGDFTAHNGLWDMAELTQHDVLARMALVPRTLEARGLDVSPAIRDKLAQVGDHAAAAILDIILRDEIGHVAIGNHWYRALCVERGLDPLTAYDALATQHRAPALRGPFNLAARKAAGFDDAELARLTQTGAATP